MILTQKQKEDLETICDSKKDKEVWVSKLLTRYQKSYFAICVVMLLFELSYPHRFFLGPIASTFLFVTFIPASILSLLGVLLVKVMSRSYDQKGRYFAVKTPIDDLVLTNDVLSLSQMGPFDFISKFLQYSLFGILLILTGHNILIYFAFFTFWAYWRVIYSFLKFAKVRLELQSQGEVQEGQIFSPKGERIGSFHYTEKKL
jgi:hypothetical protein